MSWFSRLVGYSDADVDLLRSLIESRMRAAGYSDPGSISEIRSMGTLKLAGTPEATLFTILKQIVAGVNQGKPLANILLDIERVRSKAHSDPSAFNQVLAIARSPRAEAAGEVPAAYCLYRLALEHPGRLTDQNLDNAFFKIFSHLAGYEVGPVQQKASPAKESHRSIRLDDGPVRQSPPVPAMHPGEIGEPEKEYDDLTAGEASKVGGAVYALLHKYSDPNKITENDIENSAGKGWVFSSKVIAAIREEINLAKEEYNNQKKRDAVISTVQAVFEDDGSFLFRGKAGNLQGKYHFSGDERAPGVVLLHPHPQHGGTMHNKVVYALNQAFIRSGISTLRFNFRGVGRSQGSYSAGDGELQDAASALDWLQQRLPISRSCWIAGYSFGAGIGMQLLMRRPEIDRFVIVAPPVNIFDFHFLATCPAPGLIVAGDQDEVAPHGSVEKLAEAMAVNERAEVELEIVKGANHFFTESLEAVKAVVEQYAKFYSDVVVRPRS